MENENDIEIKPNILFWESVFSSFIILKKFTKYFTNPQINLKPIDKKFPLLKLFFEFYNEDKNTENIFLEFQNYLISDNQQDLLTNPIKLFNYIICELHNELKIKDNSEITIKEKIEIINHNNTNSEIFESNREEALRLFLENNKKNKSFIQKIFFGIKEKNQKCGVCGTVSYQFSYLKYCPLNIQNIDEFVRLEDLYDSIQHDYDKMCFCVKCNKEQNFKIQVKIHSEPKILIFFIFNHRKNVKIDFSWILNNKYELKSFVMDTDDSNIINKAFCCKKHIDNKKTFFVVGKNDGKIFKYVKDVEYHNFNIKELDKGNPYILFYQKIKKSNKKENNSQIDNINDYNDNSKYEISSKETISEKKKKINKFTSFSFNLNSLISSKKSNKYTSEEKIINNGNFSKSTIDLINKNQNIDNTDNNTNTINGNNITSTDNNITKNNLNSNLNVSNNLFKKSSINKSINNSNNSEIDDLIRLYFKCNDGNVVFIDVEKTLTFENIIHELKNQYEWININDNSLYFNDIKINKKDIPRNIGIKQGDYIDIVPNKFI